MEVAGSEEAALAIAIRRREIFLGRTTELALDLDMRLLSTRIAGEFADLTGLALDAGQAARWDIGKPRASTTSATGKRSNGGTSWPADLGSRLPALLPLIVKRRGKVAIEASSLSDWSLADRGMERRFALREPATGR